MYKRFTDVINKYDAQITSFEEQIATIQKELEKANASLLEELETEVRKWLSENKFFQTKDGYIVVNKLKNIAFIGLTSKTPRIIVEGFYLRGIDTDSTSPIVYMYGYYDALAGFLLSDLTPTTGEVFCEKCKTVCEHIISHLNYTPNAMYREEGDSFDRFIKDAAKAKIDVDYYPEVNVTLK